MGIKRTIDLWKQRSKPGSVISDGAKKEVKRLERIYNKRRVRSSKKS